MKKLCIITPSLGKYSETFIQNQIDHLPFNKIVVTLEQGEFAYPNGKPLASINLVAKLIRFFNRKFLGKDFEKQQTKLLAKYLQKNKIEHVLFQYGTIAKKGYKACIKMGVSYTVHFHGYDAYINKYDQIFYKEVLSNATNVVVVSKHMSERLQFLGCNFNKINIIPYGTNFSINEQLHPEKKYSGKILAVGRFVEKKAPYLTILSFAKAIIRQPDLKLYMAGDGKLLSVCKDLVKALNIDENVFLLGSIPHHEVQKLMRETDFFIQHSKKTESGDMEGLPNAIIEALVLNKPVISTYHSGIPEIVEDGVNGFLSDEGDVEAMSENILKAVDFDFQFLEIEFLKLENSIKHLEQVLNGK